ncbi:MAG TPA: phage tail protein [Gaiellaceae bacterium]|nr:phage tail protein [Gaiellaceae bacterium]
MSEAGSGTSRRAFLGRAAGAAAAVAGAGVGAGALAKSAAAADQRTYTAGHFALQLDGASAGKFVGLDGGNLENTVVSEVPGPDHIVKKHLANVKWSDCTIQVGSGMRKGMYTWIKDAFDHGFDASARRSASVSAIGTRGEEVARRRFQSSTITEVTIPALDVQSTQVAQIAVTFSTQKVSDAKPSGLPVAAAKQKAWLCSNFRLKIDGVDASRVNAIDSFTWKCAILDDGSLGLDVGNISLSCGNASLPGWQKWLANLQGGVNDERDGTLTIVGAGAGDVLTLSLFNLGLYALRPDYPIGGLPNGRFVAEMYVERLALSVAPNKNG